MYMDISKENIFKVGYTSTLQKNVENKKWTSKFLKFIRNNKIISISIIVFFMCVMMNLFLIYNFLKVLQQV